MGDKQYCKYILSCVPEAYRKEVHGNDVMVSSLSYDSRTVRDGAAFFALPGIHTDGTLYIEAAIKNGAKAVIHEQPLSVYRDDICYLCVTDIRAVMAAAAAAFFDNPSKDMMVIGVTGTEGKTSTVSFIFQLLNAAGKKAGFFSTVAYCLGGSIVPNPEHQTTPEAITVQERLAAMRDNGCTHAVIEASSHGLSPRTGRLLSLFFDAAVFMNVTQEHLEFHKTFEQYRFDKANLFRNLDNHNHQKTAGFVPAFGVVNADDPSALYMAEQTGMPVFGFSLHNRLESAEDIYQEQLYADGIKEQNGQLLFTVSGTDSSVSLPISAAAPVSGTFNVYNLLAALLTVRHCTEKSYAELIPLFSSLQPVKGRMTRVDQGQPFEVLIDYAHTPSSFEAVLPPVHKRIRENGGKLIAVFGSGGERDTVKRSEQGRIAALYCDCIILTDEDPRGEDSATILEMIAAGCPAKTRDKDLFLIPNRPAAIRKAFSLAHIHDAVLLLGKGHENSIIYKDVTLPYDEYTEAVNALNALKTETGTL